MNRDDKTVGGLNGPWRTAFKLSVSTGVPVVVAILVFLVPSVIKNNEARAAGARYTPEMADVSNAQIQQEIDAHRVEVMRDMLQIHQDTDRKLDVLIKKLDTLSAAVHRHLGETGE